MAVVSVLRPPGAPFERAREALSRMLGPVALESCDYPFDATDYYEPEMGPGLQRRWLCFRHAVGPEELPGIKLRCAGLEERFARGGSRTVNLDPGYMDHGKLVLASFKEAPDKLYMGRGVWAHTVLRYRFGRFAAPDHSFPDFASGVFDRFMLEARTCYGRLLRAGKGS